MLVSSRKIWSAAIVVACRAFESVREIPMIRELAGFPTNNNVISYNVQNNFADLN